MLRSTSKLQALRQTWAAGQGAQGLHSSAAAADKLLYYEELFAGGGGGSAAGRPAGIINGGSHRTRGASGNEHSTDQPLTMLVVHGLLGTGRNLRTLAHNLINEAAEQTGRPWRAVLVDQRCHGKSGHLGLHPPHTLAASALDIIALFRRCFHQRGPEVAVGHSMGGKVVLELIRQLSQPGAPLALPSQAWVLDAQPGAVPSTELSSSGVSRDVLRVLQAVSAIPTPIPSRQALYSQLDAQGFSKGLQQWLASNLVPVTTSSSSSSSDAHASGVSAGEHQQQQQQRGLQWAFDLECAKCMFNDYLRLEYWRLIEAPPPGTTLHIVRAQQSDRWDPHTLQHLRLASASSKSTAAAGAALVRRGGLRYHEVPKAGHWVHVDNPGYLQQIIVPSLVEAASAASSS